MAAAVESMFFSGTTPWHGEGNKIDEAHLFDIAEGIKTAGMDWSVGLKKLQTEDNEPVPNRAVYRRSDGKILGVVGPRFTPVQNWDMFKWFQPFLEAKVAMLHTAGSLYGGEKVWVLCQMVLDNQVIAKGDEVAPFMLLANSHDGSMAVRAGWTPIRIVCANTLAMAINNASSKLIRIRHSAKVLDNMKAVRDILDIAKHDFEATAEQYRFLASRQVNTGDLRKYVKVVLGVDNVIDTELPKKTENILGEIFRMIDAGRGQDNPAIRGTYWSAYNGLNEYLNYVKGRNVSNRMGSLWFGPDATTNNKALEVALQMAN